MLIKRCGALAPANSRFRLSLGQISKTKWILILRNSQTSFYRIVRYIFPMSLKAFRIHHLLFSKSPLPNLAFVTELMRQPMRETPLGELHSLFNCHLITDFNQKVDVIWHDYEIKQFEFVFRDKRSQYVDEETGVAFRLQESSAHARARRREKDARWTEDVSWHGVACWMRHGRG